MNRVQLAGDIGELFEEEPIDLQPVGGVGVGEKVVDHEIYAEVGESQRAVVVVEFERGDARGVGLKTEHQKIGRPRKTGIRSQ